MPRSGRPVASSLEERRRVYEAADAGLSSRAIAAAVYGTPALKDRVLRLLDRRRRTTVGGLHLETATDQELEALLDDVEDSATLEELGALFQAANARLDDFEGG